MTLVLRLGCRTYGCVYPAGGKGSQYRALGIDPRREHLVLTLALAIVVAVAIKVVGALLISAMLWQQAVNGVGRVRHIGPLFDVVHVIPL